MSVTQRMRRNDSGGYTPAATADGELIYVVHAALAGEADPTTGMAARPDIIQVSLVGDPGPTIAFGTPVVFRDLVVRTGQGRDGGGTYAMFAAAGVEVASFPTSSPAGSPVPAGPAPTPGSERAAAAPRPAPPANGETGR